MTAPTPEQPEKISLQAPQLTDLERERIVWDERFNHASASLDLIMGRLVEEREKCARLEKLVVQLHTELTAVRAGGGNGSSGAPPE